MKPVRLELAGIGPYTGEPVVIDFSALGQLFLVTGPTGAGKTTIFDALSYALYGEPLGTRHKSTLRAKRARDDEPTAVMLELESGGVRYRVMRSPHNPRPGRGKSLVVEDYARLFRGARADDGSYVFTSIAEGASKVDALIKSDIVKLDHGEFSKILVLPQGEFQRFLEMNTKERAGILDKLFPTEEHKRITALALERQKVLEARVRDLQRRLDAVALPAEDFEARLALRLEALERAREGDTAARAALTRATEARATGLVLLADFEAHDALELAWCAYDAARATLDTERARLARARAARDVATSLDRRDRAREGFQKLVARATELEARLASDRVRERALAETEAAEEAFARGEGAREAQVLRALEATSSALAHTLAPHRDLAAAPDDRGEVEIETLGATIEAHVTRARHARDEAARLATLRAPRDRLQALRTLELPKAQSAIDDAKRALCAATASCEAAEAALAELESAIAHEHAATFASSLTEGDPCPVCGSQTHPALAKHRTDEHGLVRERPARRAAAEKARAGVSAAQEHVRTAEQNALLAQEAARALEARLTEAGFDTTDAFDAAFARASDAMEGEARALEALVARARHAQNALDASIATRTARLDAEAAKLAKTRADRSLILGGLAELERSAADAAAVRDEAERTLTGAIAEAEAASVRAGFESEHAVRAATLDDASQAAIERALAEHAAEGGRLEGKREASSARLEGRVRPDRAALVECERLATEAAAASAAALRREEDALTALREQAATRRALEEERATLEREGEAMRALARDLSGDNRLKLDFATYALTLWFEDVLERASDRFARLSDDRYRFVLSDEVARRQQKAGLEIDVLDAQTGGTRSVRTLSGGEKFLAALALALGLADTVRARAGGIDLDMLLIDEGFGNLDADALGRVITVLDDLGAGRQVGIVSHVEALTREIPSQVRVVPSLDGARVAVTR